MWRYTQEQIDKMDVDSFISHFEKCKKDDRCITEEVRHVLHKTLYDKEWYVVGYGYKIVYGADFWHRDVVTINKVIEEDMPFDVEWKIKEYASHTARPSSLIADHRCLMGFKTCYCSSNLHTVWHVYLKEDDWIREYIPYGMVYEVFRDSLNGGFEVLSNNPDDDRIHLTSINRAIEIIRENYLIPKKPKENTQTVTTELISNSALDRIREDVEKLKNEKNTYIAEEILKSLEYINTLRKLL